MPIQEKFDVVIIGSGSAGVSAAIWCADLGMTSVILEREAESYGQLRWINGPIRNYPGVDVRNGAELIELFDRSATAWGIKTSTRAFIEYVDCEAKTVKLAGRRSIAGSALIVATGVRRRTLGVPGELEFRGKGILTSGAGERGNVRGKRVVAVGGGDAAAENALLLSEFAERVFLVHRRSKLTARTEFQERIAATPNIEVILDSNIAEIGGTGQVEWVDVETAGGGTLKRIQTDHFIARIGVTPNSDLVASQLETDERGYLIVDSLCRTNIAGIYAIGDVANPVSPTIATAVGMGATAAKSAFSLLTSKETV